jgi:outer membrane protein TolC
MLLFALFLQVDSLSMNEAIDLALENSPIYYESRVSYEKSRLQFYEILTELLPTMRVAGSYTKSEYQGIATSGYEGSVNLTMPLFDLDIITSIFVARGQWTGSGIEHQEEIANLILRIKTAYYNLINALELLNSAEITIQRARENLELVEAKYQLGAASKLELLQGEVFYLNAAQDKSQARTLEITAQEELRSILGTESDVYPIDTLIDPGHAEIPNLDSITTMLYDVNYGVRIAQEFRRVSRLSLISSYLAFLPKISLFYSSSVFSDSLIFDFQYYRDNATKNYGISVSFPIFEIKNLIFRYLNAKKDYERSQYAEKGTELEAQKALRTTYYSLQESLDKLELAKKSYDAANEAAVIAREQYTLGLISFLDFLTAEKAIFDARVSYTQALTGYYVQQATFSYLLGSMTLNKEPR